MPESNDSPDNILIAATTILLSAGIVTLLVALNIGTTASSVHRED